MALPGTSHGLETCDIYILYVLKQSSDEEMCNCDNGSEVDASEYDDSVSSVINSDSEEIEEKPLGDARAKRPRLGENCFNTAGACKQ
jgi:hypothetical protein